MKESRFTLSRVSGAPVNTDELLADLKRVSMQVGSTVLSARSYAEHGIYDARTISRRFGSWNKAMTAAGLTGGNEVNYSDAILLKLLKEITQPTV